MDTRKFSVTMTVEVPDYGPGLETFVRRMYEVAPYAGIPANEVQTIVPLDLKVAAVLSAGEMEIREGEGVPDIITNAADNLNNAYSHDILGNVLFLGSDGRVYCVNVEAEIGPFNPELLGGEVEDIFDADPGGAVYMSVEGAPHTYGYEIIEGNGWSLIRTGGVDEENPKVLIVPTEQVFKEFDARDGRVFEGFVWDHPDKA
jgi:hypothetical protein